MLDQCHAGRAEERGGVASLIFPAMSCAAPALRDHSSPKHDNCYARACQNSCGTNSPQNSLDKELVSCYHKPRLKSSRHVPRSSRPSVAFQGRSPMAFSCTRGTGLIAALILLHLCPPSLACYKYLPGKRNPCEGVICNYSANCQPSIDGKTARCQCPSECYRYGDHSESIHVCGNDGNDYANMCELRKAACNKMQDIKVKYYGKCGT